MRQERLMAKELRETTPTQGSSKQLEASENKKCLNYYVSLPTEDAHHSIYPTCGANMMAQRVIIHIPYSGKFSREKTFTDR